MNNINRKHFNLKRQQKVGMQSVKTGIGYKDNALQEHTLAESMRMIDVLYKYADKISTDSFKHIKGRVKEEITKDSSRKSVIINDMYNECIAEFKELFNHIVNKGFDTYIEHNDYTFLKAEDQADLMSMIKAGTYNNIDIVIELIKEQLKKELAEFFDDEEEISYSDDIVDDTLDINIEVSNNEDNGSKEVTLKYIRKFVELSNFAREYDFKFLKQNGNHTHFKNDEGMLATMPNGKTVGKGLSFVIQKKIVSAGADK